MAGYRLPYPLSVGTLSAGNWASSVPDRLVAEGRLGVALGESVADARADFEQAVALACAEDPWLRANPVAVQWWGGQFAPGPGRGRRAGRPGWWRRPHTAVHGSAPAVHGVPYGSDQRLLTGLGGIPTVIYGPGDVRQAHAPDESVPVAELVSVTRTLVRLLATAV